MDRMRKTAVALVSTVALGSFTAATTPAAFADKPAPCSKQQTHVERATAKLADLTAKFAAHPSKKNKSAKKAQVQRVARATTRLDNCLADQAG
jgi:hypothetical protein